jgi:F0F1-type ATP synthase assembly protein I
MAARSLAGEALGIALRFIPILAIVGYLWWQIMPSYAWLLGHLVRGIVNFQDPAITAVAVEVKGLFKTGTELTLQRGSEEASRGITIAMLVTNVAPFIALVMATPGLTWNRRGRAIVIGCGCLFLAHLLFLLMAFYTTRNEPATALAQICLTLPFPLWIGLVYWHRIASLLAHDALKRGGTE